VRDDRQIFEDDEIDFKTRIITSIAKFVLNVWFSSCRVKIVGKEIHERYITSDYKVVGATWHRGAIFLVWFFRHAHPMIMFSKSKDGDLLSEFARKLGVIPIRGSSTRSGRSAFSGMRRYLNQPGNRKAATVLDGPKGPACVAKKGMIVLAKETGVPLLPISVSANSAITFKKTWDKTMVPLPFSRVTVMYKEPWHVSKEITDEELERLRCEVENTLNKMKQDADADTGYQWN
jgi:lysophospholipid acyltransferase (LPLAT)-like uncharacterized protein